MIVVLHSFSIAKLTHVNLVINFVPVVSMLLPFAINVKRAIYSSTTHVLITVLWALTQTMIIAEVVETTVDFATMAVNASNVKMDQCYPMADARQVALQKVILRIISVWHVNKIVRHAQIQAV